MAHLEYLNILYQGSSAWNQWRQSVKERERLDLAGADLSCRRLDGVNLRDANLKGASFDAASLKAADLQKSNLSYANLEGARLGAANLELTQLVGTNLRGADITDCLVYGISAWDLDLVGASQSNLSIRSAHHPRITVDSLEVAQFLYLLLYNEKIRGVIDTITSKAVLILGRFTPERKIVLDALRHEFRKRNFVPIIFDFDQPRSKNLTETVSTLAHLCRFVIADLTDARSLPQELQRIVPDNPSLPIQPLILDSQYEYAMFKDFLDYPWVLMPYRYDNMQKLLDALDAKIISPVIAKAHDIEERRKAIEQEIAKTAG